MSLLPNQPVRTGPLGPAHLGKDCLGRKHEVASVWDGLTDSSGDLLEVGYYTDATAWMTYGQTYYELGCQPGDSSCPGASGETYGFASGQLQHVKFGDDVEELLEISGLWTVWSMYVMDYTTGVYAEAAFTLSSWFPSGFFPQWVQFMVQAYESGGIVQQIAKFSQVIFCDATWRSTSTSWTTYGQPYNQYQLQQASGNDNTNQGYYNGDCGHGGTYGAPTVTWVNSNYNYAYVNG